MAAGCSAPGPRSAAAGRLVAATGVLIAAVGGAHLRCSRSSCFARSSALQGRAGSRGGFVIRLSAFSAALDEGRGGGGGKSAVAPRGTRRQVGQGVGLLRPHAYHHAAAEDQEVAVAAEETPQQAARKAAEERHSWMRHAAGSLYSG